MTVMNLADEIENLSVITYPHPALRRRAKPLTKVDRTIRKLVDKMFQLMYEHRGVGLAANQVNLPFQLFVVNEEGSQDFGRQRVFINPVIESPKGRREVEEGCLSIPQVYANVVRPEEIRVMAFEIDGTEVDEVVSGSLARVIQHEYDHLQGVLFTDRISETAQLNLAGELESFEIEFESKRRSKAIPDDTEIEARLVALEQLYC
ncbi:MAG TPA: peptide deformylase [Pirellulaceae bacterium]|nr:peptide deformylase [Pirellulaceae bacterium]HMP68335.1 peptide deformylase [Pirellulaceae bacterium]